MSIYTENVPGASQIIAELQIKGNPGKAVVDMQRVRGGRLVADTFEDLDDVPQDLLKAHVTIARVIATNSEYIYTGSEWVRYYPGAKIFYQENVMIEQLGETNIVHNLNASFNGKGIIVQVIDPQYSPARIVPVSIDPLSPNECIIMIREDYSFVNTGNDPYHVTIIAL